MLLSTAPYVEGRRGITFPLKALRFRTSALKPRHRRMASPRRWDIDGSTSKLLTLLRVIRDCQATDR